MQVPMPASYILTIDDYPHGIFLHGSVQDERQTPTLGLLDFLGRNGSVLTE